MLCETFLQFYESFLCTFIVIHLKLFLKHHIRSQPMLNLILGFSYILNDMKK